MKYLFIFALCLFMGIMLGQTVNNAFQNPVIPKEHPDPTIIQVGNVYYSCATSTDWAPHFPIYQTKDLKNWDFVGYVFNKNPEWTISGFWAPEFMYYRNKFYCYYTARNTKGISCIGVATTDSISKGFVDHGIIIEWGNEAIDSYVLKDDDQNLYITWKAYGLDPNNPIQILCSGLTDDGLHLKGEPFSILTADKSTWEEGGIEGECLFKKDGYYYMLYSGAACCDWHCNYKVGVARSKSINGPWERYANNPILVGDDNWKCPGHGTCIKTDEGKWVYHYHAYPAKGFVYLGRMGMISEIKWTPDGWPEMKDGKSPFNSKEPNSNSTLSNDNIHDDFIPDHLQPSWQWNFSKSTPRFELQNGRLNVTSTWVDKDNKAGTALCVALQHENYSISTEIVNKNGALKGLVVYGTHENAIGVGIKNDKLILWTVKKNEFLDLNELNLSHPENCKLKISVKEGHLLKFFYCYDKGNWKEVKAKNQTQKFYNTDYLSWWCWADRSGLSLNQSEGQNGLYEYFDLTYNN